MAQGYIVSSNGSQSVEDVAEENFKILLRRCFFQDVKRDEYDEIESVKIHDLMHDVAQEVGGGEFQVLTSVENALGERTRHVNINDENCFKSSCNWSNLRTLLTSALAQNHDTEICKDTKVGKWKSLRVLELKCLKKGILLDSIGELQHLRYLDLSDGEFEELPNSIIKLHNLQTLILFRCANLTHLPHDFSKLAKLSYLNLDQTSHLTGMPLGLDKLTGLRSLTDFIVGKNKNITEKPSDDELKDLGALTNLTGSIWIGIFENYRNVELMKDMEGGYLSKIPGLKEVEICLPMNRDAVIETHEAALEKLEPHSNIKILKLFEYKGRTIPWWRRAKDNSATIIQLSNLVDIEIHNCLNLVSLPSFSKLPFLRSLYLFSLDNLEYMETRCSLGEASGTTLFPSLETLYIEGCRKWKGGWFKEDGLGDAHYGSRGILPFPCLSTLDIWSCHDLTSFPPCQSLQTLKIHFCSKLEGLPEWISCLSSLQSLTIYHCDAIESLPEGIQTLTSLQNLKIEDCDGLKERCREPDGQDWPKIQHIPNKQLTWFDYDSM